MIEKCEEKRNKIGGIMLIVLMAAMFAVSANAEEDPLYEWRAERPEEIALAVRIARETEPTSKNWYYGTIGQHAFIFSKVGGIGMGYSCINGKLGFIISYGRATAKRDISIQGQLKPESVFEKGVFYAQGRFASEQMRRMLVADETIRIRVEDRIREFTGNPMANMITKECSA